MQYLRLILGFCCLTVRAADVAPSISTQPSALTVPAGCPVTFAAKLFWLALLAIGACLLVNVKVHGATQGDGARKLVRWAKVIQMPTSPLAAPAASRTVPIVREEHFAVTATGATGLESDYSSEAVLLHTNRIQTVTCAWDPPDGTNTVALYTLYQGATTGTYTNSVQTTNTQATIRISPPLLTNVVLTVTSIGLTNIAWCDKLKGRWALLGVTNFVTNAASAKSLLFRGLGRPATVVKRLYWQSRLQ